GLHDGAGELTEGSETLKDSLKTLASKSIEVTDGDETAHEGASDLADGATTLARGIAELYINSNKLRNTSEALQSEAKQLADGISGADGGVLEMKGKVPQLVDGTNQVQVGLGKFHEELPKAMSKQINHKLNEGSEAIIDGTNQLQTGIVNGLEEKLAPELSQGLADGLSKGLANGVVKEANSFIGNAPEAASNTISKEVTNLLNEKEAEKKNELIEILRNAEVSEETIQNVENKLNESSPDYDRIEQLIDNQLQVVLEESLKDVKITQDKSEEHTSELQSR